MKIRRVSFRKHREEIHNIRRKVFIEEQNVPESSEWDAEEEIESTYYACFIKNEMVGILRLRAVLNHIYKLERVAVLKEFRGKGVATRLLRYAMRKVMYDKTFNGLIYAYAQQSAIKLYTSLGFLVFTGVYFEEETDIPHQSIFWAHPHSLNNFLKNCVEPCDKPHDLIDRKFHENMVNISEKSKVFRYWNLQSFHLQLDDEKVSKFLIQRFIKLCETCENYMNFLDVLTLVRHLSPEERDKRCSDGPRDRRVSRKKILDDIDQMTGIVENQLNTGHYDQRHTHWETLYGLLCLLKGLLFANEGKYSEAVRILDRGILMGSVDEYYIPLREYVQEVHKSITREIVIRYHSHLVTSSQRRQLTESLHSIPVREAENDENVLELLLNQLRDDVPLVIRGYAKQWEAVQKWNFVFLFNILHTRSIPVEVGSQYSQNDWSQTLMTFREFVNNKANQKMYIAQHDLVRQVPILKNDLVIPEVCFNKNDKEENVHCNLWIGPADTVSPLHNDPRHNMFVQIHGSKVIRLCSPDKTSSIYPHENFLENTSQVDAENPDYAKHPEFRNVQLLDTTLNAGDALLIPAKWYHYIRSTEPSISASFWFD